MPEPLAELRELLQRATPRPWQVDGPYWWHAGDSKPVITVGEDRDAVAIMPPDGTGTTVDRHHADAALIVALRNQGEALLEAAEALEEIRRLAEWYSSTHAGPDLEVYHALKVEVLDIAERALASLADAPLTADAGETGAFLDEKPGNE
jgi:hypothetical protein